MGRLFKVMAAALVLLLLMVWEHVEALSLERQVRAFRQEADRLTYENARLQMQINQWVSPSHLESVARDKLGMVAVDSKHLIGL